MSILKMRFQKNSSSLMIIYSINEIVVYQIMYCIIGDMEILSSLPKQELTLNLSKLYVLRVYYYTIIAVRISRQLFTKGIMAMIIQTH